MNKTTDISFCTGKKEFKSFQKYYKIQGMRRNPCKNKGKKTQMALIHGTFVEVAFRHTIKMIAWGEKPIRNLYL